MGAADVMAALERLKNAGIIQQTRVVPDPVYRFKHVLTQEVAYNSLLSERRKLLHVADLAQALSAPAAARLPDGPEPGRRR